MAINNLEAFRQMNFRHLGRSATAFADVLAKQEVSIIVPLGAMSLSSIRVSFGPILEDGICMGSFFFFSNMGLEMFRTHYFVATLMLLLIVTNIRAYFIKYLFLFNEFYKCVLLTTHINTWVY